MTFLDAHAYGLFIALAMVMATVVISAPLVAVVRVVPIAPSRAGKKQVKA